jgi:hypothetical protein
VVSLAPGYGAVELLAMTPDQAQRIEQFHRQHAPLQPWVLEAIADDPRLFGVTAPSRGELRKMPLRFILWSMPPLVYPDGSPAAPLIHELADWRVRITRADVDSRKRIAVLARRAWVRLVELASGVNVEVAPGNLVTVPLLDV